MYQYEPLVSELVAGGFPHTALYLTWASTKLAVMASIMKSSCLKPAPRGQNLRESEQSNSKDA